MGVRVTSEAADFRSTTFPFLQRDPVLHTIIMSNVAERAAGTLPPQTGTSYFVSVHDETGEVIGVARKTPERPVYLGALREDLAAEVATAYAELVPDLGGVAGNRAAVRAFAERWAELRGATATESRGTRLHRLGTLTPLSAVGKPRPMTMDDVQLAADWHSDGFRDEFSSADISWATRQLELGTLWFWEVDGEPVSMVGYHLPIFGVCRVGPVYTPPKHRRNGYAGALTAHLSGKILAQGNQACLYTDLANPTSNKIYAQLGYVPVADFIALTFA
jgi:GNAT superfamily N-acetyltransferase